MQSCRFSALQCIIQKETCDTCKKVYIEATVRHFITRKNENLRGKNKYEIAFHKHPPKRNNFTILRSFKFHFIAESLFIGSENINKMCSRKIK